MDTDEMGPTLSGSTLDRLLDEHPGEPHEPRWWQAYDIRRLKGIIARDLEALLNTRMELLEEIPDGFVEVARSPITFGLRDVTSLSAVNVKDRQRVRKQIEQAIELFEPRLTNVRVTFEAMDQRAVLLRFRIQAMLPVEPTPEPIVFDTDLHLDAKRYTIRN